jgi:alpha-1,2-mannosyltransferase
MSRFGRVTRTAGEWSLFGLLPAFFTWQGLAHYARQDVLAIDFHRQYWVVGRRVLDGLSPYDRSWQDVSHGIGFPYPPLDALLFVPFALLPHGAADWLFTGLSIVAALLTLWVLDVRDWRIYGVVLLWAPVVSAWQTANLTLLLGLGIAAAWRYRERPHVAGALVGLLVSIKLFMWPLGIWLVATRRYTSLAWAFAVGTGCNVIAWAIIGFDQISPYKALNSAFTRVGEPQSYNVLHLALDQGAGRAAAYALQVIAVVAVAAACVVRGRRRHEQEALILSVAASLLAAPVIWLHYFALLLVPLALAMPRLHLVWALPLALFVCPVHKPVTWQLLAVIAVTGLIVVTTVGAARRVPLTGSPSATS